jgi:hypothetical protein
MGIAALANAVPQLSVRDRWIGWTPRYAVQLAESKPWLWSGLRAALLRTLRNAREAIRSEDLLAEVGPAENEELERRLLAIAREADTARDRSLTDRQARLDRGELLASMRELPKDRDGNIDWVAASNAPLYRRKRAQTLAHILSAERELSAAPTDGEAFAALAAHREEVRRALAIATREVRKVGLASRLLELNVCGAVPPYRDLLVGKLMALAVASREVGDWYKERYRAHVSEIASQMAGREVVRSPVICAVSTTSLYGVAASQYNRLRLTVIEGDMEYPIRWEDLGLSGGFGTVHLSTDTLRALRRVSIRATGNRSINNVFGEGTSPRLRQVREALSHLGIASEAILKHSAQRRVYGLELFSGGLHALRFNEASTPATPHFGPIAAAWRDRWLLNRITRREVLDRVAGVTAQSVSAELHPSKAVHLEAVRPPGRHTRPSVPAPGTSPLNQSTEMSLISRADLVQGLYRAAAACADHHDLETVELLHIKTAVDDFVLDQATSGKVVFVTGNPGDGKTHLLRRHAGALKAAGVLICLDANERPDDDLVALVDDALKRKLGCAIAINQGILVDLLRHASKREWARTVRDQLLQPYVYLSSGSGGDPHRDGHDVSQLVVVDLNLRNNLGPEVVRGALARLVSLSSKCAVCPRGMCAGVRNAARLANDAAARRVVDLLDLVGRVGAHATMRDLQAFLSYLIFGGQQCDASNPEERDATPYWTHAFKGGVGPLFDAVRRMDPVDQPMPLLDDLLWRHVDRQEDWVGVYEEVSTSGQGLEARRENFVSQKRRALFEHREGHQLLENSGAPVDRLFLSLTEADVNRARTVVRMLNRFYDKDEEQDDVLFLWVTHRYDARTSRYAASAVSVPTSTLEVAVPTLPPLLAQAFPDLRPDHVMLRLKPPAEGHALRLDRQFLEATHAADQGLPTTFRRGEPDARIAAFYDRLAKTAWSDASKDALKVKLVDIDTGKNLPLTVDVSNRRYELY